MPGSYCILDPVRLSLWITAATGIVSLLKWLGKGYVYNVENRFVLVTGCDSGFGYRLVLRLDGMGCYVFAACLTPEGATELTKETSERVITFLMDVTRDDDIERAVEYVSRNLPPDQGLWAVVNNAGIMGSMGPLEALTRAHYIHVLNVNTLGMTQVTRNFLPLVRRERGRIINSLSMAAWMPIAPGANCMTQAASTAFNDVLRQEMYQHGITVHGVMTGPYITSLTDLNNQRQLLTTTFARATPYVRQIYGDDFVEKMMEIIERMLKLCADTNLEEVVDAYVHAIFAKSPKTHYVQGKLAMSVMRPLSWLPPWISTMLLQPLYLAPKDVASNKSIVRSISKLWENVQHRSSHGLERRSSRLSVSGRRSNISQVTAEPAAAHQHQHQPQGSSFQPPGSLDSQRGSPSPPVPQRHSAPQQRTPPIIPRQSYD